MSVSELYIDASKPWCNVRCNDLTVDSTATVENLNANVGRVLDLINNNINFFKSNVTQATSPTTAVALNAQFGTITTQPSGTIASGGAYSFDVVNSNVLSNDSIFVQINALESGGVALPNMIPYVIVSDIATGSFKINICNIGNSNMVSNAFKIIFWIIHTAV